MLVSPFAAVSIETMSNVYCEQPVNWKVTQNKQTYKLEPNFTRYDTKTNGKEMETATILIRFSHFGKISKVFRKHHRQWLISLPRKYDLTWSLYLQLGWVGEHDNWWLRRTGNNFQRICLLNASRLSDREALSLYHKHTDNYMLWHLFTLQKLSEYNCGVVDPIMTCVMCWGS